MAKKKAPVYDLNAYNAILSGMSSSTPVSDYVKAPEPPEDLSTYTADPEHFNPTWQPPPKPVYGDPEFIQPVEAGYAQQEQPVVQTPAAVPYIAETESPSAGQPLTDFSSPEEVISQTNTVASPAPQKPLNVQDLFFGQDKPTDWLKAQVGIAGLPSATLTPEQFETYKQYGDYPVEAIPDDKKAEMAAITAALGAGKKPVNLGAPLPPDLVGGTGRTVSGAGRLLEQIARPLETADPIMGFGLKNIAKAATKAGDWVSEAFDTKSEGVASELLRNIPFQAASLAVGGGAGTMAAGAVRQTLPKLIQANPALAAKYGSALAKGVTYGTGVIANTAFEAGVDAVELRDRLLHPEKEADPKERNKPPATEEEADRAMWRTAINESGVLLLENAIETLPALRAASKLAKGSTAKMLNVGGGTKLKEAAEVIGSMASEVFTETKQDDIQKWAKNNASNDIPEGVHPLDPFDKNGLGAILQSSYWNKETIKTALVAGLLGGGTTLVTQRAFAQPEPDTPELQRETQLTDRQQAIVADFLAERRMEAGPAEQEVIVGLFAMGKEGMETAADIYSIGGDGLRSRVESMAKSVDEVTPLPKAGQDRLNQINYRLSNGMEISEGDKAFLKDIPVNNSGKVNYNLITSWSEEDTNKMADIRRKYLSDEPLTQSEKILDAKDSRRRLELDKVPLSEVAALTPMDYALWSLSHPREIGQANVVRQTGGQAPINPDTAAFVPRVRAEQAMDYLTRKPSAPSDVAKPVVNDVAGATPIAIAEQIMQAKTIQERYSAIAAVPTELRQAVLGEIKKMSPAPQAQDAQKTNGTTSNPTESEQAKVVAPTTKKQKSKKMETPVVSVAEATNVAKEVSSDNLSIEKLPIEAELENAKSVLKQTLSAAKQLKKAGKSTGPKTKIGKDVLEASARVSALQAQIAAKPVAPMAEQLKPPVAEAVSTDTPAASSDEQDYQDWKVDREKGIARDKQEAADGVKRGSGMLSQQEISDMMGRDKGYVDRYEKETSSPLPADAEPNIEMREVFDLQAEDEGVPVREILKRYINEWSTEVRSMVSELRSKERKGDSGMFYNDMTGKYDRIIKNSNDHPLVQEFVTREGRYPGVSEWQGVAENILLRDNAHARNVWANARDAKEYLDTLPPEEKPVKSRAKKAKDLKVEDVKPAAPVVEPPVKEAPPADKKSEPIKEPEEPERGKLKKHSSYKKWGIYHDGVEYHGFLPETSPKTMDSSEWTADSVQEIKDFIDSYNLDDQGNVKPEYFDADENPVEYTESKPSDHVGTTIDTAKDGLTGDDFEIVSISGTKPTGSERNAKVTKVLSPAIIDKESGDVLFDKDGKEMKAKLEAEWMAPVVKKEPVKATPQKATQEPTPAVSTRPAELSTMAPDALVDKKGGATAAQEYLDSFGANKPDDLKDNPSWRVVNGYWHAFGKDGAIYHFANDTGSDGAGPSMVKGKATRSTEAKLELLNNAYSVAKGENKALTAKEFSSTIKSAISTQNNWREMVSLLSAADGEVRKNASNEIADVAADIMDNAESVFGERPVIEKGSDKKYRITNLQGQLSGSDTELNKTGFDRKEDVVALLASADAVLEDRYGLPAGTLRYIKTGKGTADYIARIQGTTAPQEEVAKNEKSGRAEPKRDKTDAGQQPGAGVPVKSDAVGRSTAGARDAGKTKGRTGEKTGTAEKAALQKSADSLIQTSRSTVRPPAVDDIVAKTGDMARDLLRHQVEGVNLAWAGLQKNGAFLIADGAGAGKTRQGLGVAKIARENGVDRVLILTEKDSIIRDAWINEAVNMNIPLTVVSKFKNNTEKDAALKKAVDAGVDVRVVSDWGQVGKDEPGIFVTMYSKTQDTSTYQVPAKGWGLVVFDESHNIKNYEKSQQAKWGMQIINDPATKSLFLSATPYDRLQDFYYLAKAFGMASTPKDFYSWLDKHGIERKVFEKQGRAGSVIQTVTYQRRANFSLQNYLEMLEDLGAKMTGDGQMVKREVRLDGLEFIIKEVPLESSDRANLRLIEETMGNRFKSEAQAKRQTLMAQRRHLENAKIRGLKEIVEKELSEGRRVGIFVGYKEAADVKANRDGDIAMSSESVIKELRDILSGVKVTTPDGRTIDLGKQGIAELHGGLKETGEISPQAQKNIDDFQSSAKTAGHKDVIIATIDFGATGINLNDDIGDAPRTQIIVTPAMSAMKHVQVLGRMYRLNSKSPTRAYLLTTDTDIDRTLTNILTLKMQTLGAMVKGDVEKLRLDDKIVQLAVEAGEGVVSDMMADAVTVSPTPQRREQPLMGAFVVNTNKPGFVSVSFPTYSASQNSVREFLRAAGFRFDSPSKSWYSPYNATNKDKRDKELAEAREIEERDAGLPKTPGARYQLAASSHDLAAKSLARAVSQSQNRIHPSVVSTANMVSVWAAITNTNIEYSYAGSGVVEIDTLDLPKEQRDILKKEWGGNYAKIAGQTQYGRDPVTNRWRSKIFLFDTADPTTTPHEGAHSYFTQRVTPSQRSAFDRWVVESGIGRSLEKTAGRRIGTTSQGTDAYSRDVAIQENFAVIGQTLLLNKLQTEGHGSLEDLFIDHLGAYNEHRRYSNIINTQLPTAPVEVLQIFKEMLAPIGRADRVTGRKNHLQYALSNPVDTSAQNQYSSINKQYQMGGDQNDTGRNDLGGAEAGIRNVSGRSEGQPANDLRGIQEATGSPRASVDPATAEEFHAVLKREHPRIKRKAFVEVKSLEDYKKYRTFLSKDKMSGFAITPDGDMVSLFRGPDSMTIGDDLMVDAILSGGEKLDNFASDYLVNLYGSYGVVFTGKTPFNREYAPDGWNYEQDGEPPVVAAYIPQDREKELSKKPVSAQKIIDALPLFDDYDAMIADRDAKLDTHRAKAAQEKTDNFRKWFAGSKVVDENGAPIVVYHGSPVTGIGIFNTAPSTASKSKMQSMWGTHFTESPTQADVYASRRKKQGEVYPAYLSMKNPLDLHTAQLFPMDSAYAKLWKSIPEKFRRGLDMFHSPVSQKDGFRFTGMSIHPQGIYLALEKMAPQAARSLIEQAGFDGVIYDAIYRGGYTPGTGRKDKSYVVFNPEQIKSATKNNGGFDAGNPSQYYQLGYHAGDLGKAEALGAQLGSRRGTGHFGTGTYFLSSDVPLKNESKNNRYKDRPQHAVEMDGYNLYKPAGNRDAKDLHDGLKAINSLANAWGPSVSFGDAIRDFPGLIKALSVAPTGPEKAYTKYIVPIMDSIQNETQDNQEWWFNKNLDSASTRYMKQLGYEGVDVRHLPDYDNTEFGSVIYDVKPSTINYQLAAPVGNPAFDEWFGESKIVAPNGNPLVVYHGTGAGDILEFSSVTPNFFTASMEYANGYTGKSGNRPRVFAGYLSIQRPFDTRTTEHRDIYNEQFVPYAKDRYADNGRFVALKSGEAIPFTTANQFFQWMKGAVRRGEVNADGMIVDEHNGNGIAYVPLKNTQIKSIKNLGGWTQDDARVNYQLAAPVSPLGFYSAVENAILEMNFGSMPAKNLLASIANTSERKLGYEEWVSKASADMDAAYNQLAAETDPAKKARLEAVYNKKYGDNFKYQKAFENYESAYWGNYIKLPKATLEEIEDLGLIDWLQNQQGKVTKQEVLDFVRQGGIQLEETRRGSYGNEPTETEIEDIAHESFDMDFASKWDNFGEQLREIVEERAQAIWEENKGNLQADYVVTDEQAARAIALRTKIQDLSYQRSHMPPSTPAHEKYAMSDEIARLSIEYKTIPEDGYDIFIKEFKEKPDSEMFTHDEWVMIKKEVWDSVEVDYLDSARESLAQQQLNRDADDPDVFERAFGEEATKYEIYQLPGGENYREYLLRLPTDKNLERAQKLRSEIYTLTELTRQFRRRYQANYDQGDADQLAKLMQREHGLSDRIRAMGRMAERDEGAIEDAINERTFIRKEIDRFEQKKVPPPHIATAYQNNKTALDAAQKELESIGDVKEPYQGGHWSEPNVLVHFRVSDRIDADGNKVLWIEEIQSDWHQAGRKGGYSKLSEAEVRSLTDELARLEAEARDGLQDDSVGDAAIDALYVKIDALRAKLKASSGAVPNAPAKTTTAWTMLALKRILRLAAEGGYDKVAWTPGIMQVNRWKNAVRQSVDSIYWEKNDDGTITIVPNKNDEPLFERKDSLKEITKIIGKDMVDKIESDPSTQGQLEGDDLTVGGEGFKGYYDKIVPAELGKYLKKIDKGASVGSSVIFDESVVSKGGDVLSGENGNILDSGDGITVPSVTMTQKIRDAVLGGQTYYQLAVPDVFGPDMNVPTKTAKPIDEKSEAAQWARKFFGETKGINGQETWKNFMIWFGDSKVTTRGVSKIPMMMYHGTVAEEDFDAFQLMPIYTNDGEVFPNNEPGFHFGTLKAAQERLWVMTDENARVLPVFLKIEKPLLMADVFGNGIKMAEAIQLRFPGKGTPEKMALSDALTDYYDVLRDNGDTAEWLSLEDATDAVVDAARDLVESQGYDGFMYQNSAEDKGSMSYIALHSEQVKSPFNNDFSVDDSRMNYQLGTPLGAQPLTPEQRKAIDTTIIGTRSDGKPFDELVKKDRKMPDKYEYEKQVQEQERKLQGGRQWWNKIARDRFYRLPKNGEFAPARYDMHQLMAQDNIARTHATAHIRGLVDGLDQKAYEVFNNYVYFSDLLAENKRNPDRKNPYGMTLKEVEDNFNRFDLYAKAMPEVMASIAKRDSFQKKLVEDYKAAMKAVGLNVDEKFTRENYFRHMMVDYAAEEVYGFSALGNARINVNDRRGFLKDRKEEGTTRGHISDFMVPEYMVTSQMLFDIETAKFIKELSDNYDITPRLKKLATEINHANLLELITGDFMTEMSKKKKTPTQEQIAKHVKQVLGSMNAKQAFGLRKLLSEAEQGMLPEGPNGKYADLINRLAEAQDEMRTAIREVQDTFDMSDAEEKKIANTIIAGIQADLSPADMNRLFEYATWLLKQEDALPGQMASATLFKGIREKRELIKKKLGDEYLDWRGLLNPDMYEELQEVAPKEYKSFVAKLNEYSLWQPREGQVFYRLQTLGDKIIDSLTDDAMEALTSGRLKQEDIKRTKQLVVMGGKRKEIVLPTILVETLQDLGAKSNFMSWFRPVTNVWRNAVLFMPERFLPYSLRNVSSDLAVAMANPRMVKHVGKAIKDITNHFASGFDIYRKATVMAGQSQIMTGDMTPELKDWFEQGGFNSLFTIQEIGDENNLRLIRSVLDKEGSKGVLEHLKNAATKLLPVPGTANWRNGNTIYHNYFTAVKSLNAWRESILRYANYLSYLEQLEKNNGTPKNYGASKPQEINALKDNKQKAYILSNQLLGAYDQISYTGAIVRENIAPFWSFQEMNFKRQIQIIKNASVSHADATEFATKTIGASLGIALPVVGRLFSVATLWAMGTTLMKLAWLEALLAGWNEWQFPEEEESLPKDVRAKPHLIIGKTSEGKVILFTRIGALADFTEWFGVDQKVAMDLTDVMNGKMTKGELIMNMVQQPFQKTFNSVFPLAKMGVEILTGKSFYPDIMKPRTVTDPTLKIWNDLGLGQTFRFYTKLLSQNHDLRGNEWWQVEPRPTPGGAMINPLRFALNESDPKQVAYYYIQDAKNRFMKEIGKDRTFSGTIEGAENIALLHYRQAIRYGDLEAARYYLEQYAQVGGTKEKMKTSIKNMDPVAGIPKKQVREFMASLTPSEKLRFDQATEYYRDVIASNKALVGEVALMNKRQKAALNRKNQNERKGSK